MIICIVFAEIEQECKRHSQVHVQPSSATHCLCLCVLHHVVRGRSAQKRLEVCLANKRERFSGKTVTMN